jgi:hypothetical protein
MTNTRKKKLCKCRIRGIVDLWKIKGDMYYAIDPYERPALLRKFKYCPICGKKLD